MQVQADVVEGGSDFVPRQILRLERGEYAGLLARYSEPKDYKKFNTDEMERKFGVTVLVAARNGQLLTAFSEGFTMLRTKAFYDPQTQMQSGLVGFFFALMGGKLTREEIVEAAKHQQLPDLDTLIGKPVRVFIEPAAKADKHGLFSNKIREFMPADKATIVTLKPIAPQIKRGTTERGLDYLEAPSPSYQDEAGSAPTQSDNDELWDGFDNLDKADEIPF